MGLIEKTGQINITAELIEAIASMDITKVACLLAENGEYWIQNENNDIVLASKVNYLKWMGDCFNKFLSANRGGRTRLDYIILKCLHCRTRDPVIIFENGKFPVSFKNSGQKKECGLIVESADNKIIRIAMCFLILKSEDPYIFERKCS